MYFICQAAEETLLTGDAKRRIVTVDWPEVINRWVEDYSVAESNTLASSIEPRGLTALTAKFRMPVH